MLPPRKLEHRIFIGAAVVFACVSVYATRVADPDMWGHLCYGRFFAEQGLQAEDPFAYTSEHCTWVAHEYLSQILMWKAYALGGALGLLLLKCLVGGAAVLCIYFAVRAGSDDVRIWAPALILTTGIVCRSFLFRPQLFTFLFFSFFVMILFRYLLGRLTVRWLLLLPPLLALWVNMHGGFVAGLGAIGLAGLLRLLQSLFRNDFFPRHLVIDTWPLAVILLFALMATLLNPLGYRLWPYLVTELSNHANRELIDEWGPLQWPKHMWSGSTLSMLLLGLAMTTILAHLPKLAEADDDSEKPSAQPHHNGFHTTNGTPYLLRKKFSKYCHGLPPWLWLLSCAPLTIMALQTVRHIPILTIWAAPVLAVLAQFASNKEEQAPLWQRAWLIFTALIALPALVTCWLVLTNPWPRITIDNDVALGPERPFRAVAFMKHNNLEGNVYNPLWWGSYLTWELYPNVQVAMDGRNVTLFPADMVEANLRYYAAPQGQTSFDVLAKYPRTDFLLLPKSSGVIARLRTDKRWFQLYADEDAELYVRNDTTHRDIIRHALAGELAQPGPILAYFE